MTDNEKILVIVKIAGLVQANPNPSTESNPPDNPRALFNDLLKRLGGAVEVAAFGSTLGLLFAASS